MSETQRAKELAEAHWYGYVQPMLQVHGQSDELIDIIGFHYISATVHGHRHGVEDERSGLFRPRIGEYPPAHPYLHKDEVKEGKPVPRNCNNCHSDTCAQIGSGKDACYCWVGPDKRTGFGFPLSPSEVKEIAESVAPPVLCDSCKRKGHECLDVAKTECRWHLPKASPSDEWETKDLCRRCGRVFLPSGKRCDLAGEKRKVANCENFASNAVPLTPAPLSLSSAKFSYNFPAAEKFMGMLKSDYVVKLRSEVSEVSDAIGPRDAAIELMDVIHVAETAIRTLAQDYGLDLDDLADHVVAKNRQRGYYQR